MSSAVGVIPLKFIVVGDCQVGKSCLVRAFSELPFDSSYSATVGVTFTVKQVAWEDLTLRIQLWDTAGQEAYRSITHTYYRDSHCAFVVYDITQAQTFDEVESWIADVKKHCPPNCVIVLIGNKLDLEIRRQVAPATLQTFAAQQGILCHEASAKTSENVPTLFKSSITAVLERRQAAQQDASKPLESAPGKQKCCG
jgi:small GTP-binding protein